MLYGRFFSITTTSDFSIRTAMLMAAGLGTRLLPFTQLKSKALLPLMGVPVAQFPVDMFQSAGINEVVVNVHHHANFTEMGLKALDWGKAKFFLSDENQILLGSAGGIKNASHFFGQGGVLLANADVLAALDVLELCRAHALNREKNGAWITLAIQTGKVPGAYREIVFDPKTHRVTRAGEVTHHASFFSGVAILEKEAYQKVPNGVPSEFLSEILLPAIAEKKCFAFPWNGSWLDVGTPQEWFTSHIKLMALMESGKIPKQWRSRVDVSAEQVGTLQWSSRSAFQSGIQPNWKGSGYWDGGKIAALRDFGPNAVLYGDFGEDVHEGKSWINGIGMDGQWKSLE